MKKKESVLELKLVRSLDVLLCGVIVFGAGLLGFNSNKTSKASQRSLQNHYFMAKVVSDKATNNKSQSYVGKFSKHHVKYISLESLNAHCHSHNYFNVFSHIYTTHKLGGHIITTTKQLQRVMPQHTSTMSQMDLQRALSGAKENHGLFIKQAGHKHSLVQIMQAPKPAQKMVRKLMYNHKATMKKIIKKNRKIQKIEQKQQMMQQKQQQSQGQTQQMSGQPQVIQK